MSAKLPRWHPRDQRGRDALKVWTIARLNDDLDLALASNRHSITRWLVEMAAEHSNFQPLLALTRTPFDLRPYLRAPERRRKRGEYQRHPRPWAIERAADDVQHMRAIWRAHFKGLWKRSDGLAEEIACERWAVAPEDLANALKRTSRK